MTRDEFLKTRHTEDGFWKLLHDEVAKELERCMAIVRDLNPMDEAWKQPPIDPDNVLPEFSHERYIGWFRYIPCRGGDGHIERIGGEMHCGWCLECHWELLQRWLAHERSRCAKIVRDAKLNGADEILAGWADPGATPQTVVGRVLAAIAEGQQ